MLIYVFLGVINSIIQFCFIARFYDHGNVLDYLMCVMKAMCTMFTPMLQDGWAVKVLDESSVFENVSLLTKDWMDYDAKSNLPVSVSDMKCRFVRE